MKDKWWCDRTRELQTVADTKNAKKFFTELKTVYEPSSKGSIPLFDVDGHTVIKEPTLITERWAQHFNQLLNCQSTISEDAIAEVPQRPVIKELDKLPTVDEPIKVIKRLSSSKASGEDGISPEVYKYGGDELAAELTHLFKKLWAEGEVPQDLKMHWVFTSTKTNMTDVCVITITGFHSSVSPVRSLPEWSSTVLLPTLTVLFQRANAILDLVETQLICYLQPDKSKKNAGSKTLTCTWCLPILPKLLTLLAARDFGSFY